MVVDLHRLRHLDCDDIAGAKRSMQLGCVNSDLSIRKFCTWRRFRCLDPSSIGADLEKVE